MERRVNDERVVEMCVTGPIFVLFHTVQCDQSVDAFSFSLSKPFSCVCVPNDDNKNVAYISSLAGLEKVTKKIGSIHHVGWWRLTFVEIHHRNDAGFLSLSQKKKKKKATFLLLLSTQPQHAATSSSISLGLLLPISSFRFVSL